MQKIKLFKIVFKPWKTIKLFQIVMELVKYIINSPVDAKLKMMAREIKVIFREIFGI